ncbi:hypothetical protein B7P43_G10743 [Cryptotermes secundus]|uniref:Uncharacterized protein n=1 Tax=Cryptotermes secundus TaxID=105785 RepID=A0A2J7R134_9NEOP|nr:hypothetical protein B7P43_G10743 [Cryptotermes secundus]
MPPFVPVQSLYSSCLTTVFENLLESVKKTSNTVEHLRKVIQSSLHAGIREHLIHITTAHCRNNIYVLLDLLSILLDQAVKQLDHSGGDDNSCLRAEQCSALLSTLEQCQATGLQELTVKVRLDPRRAGDIETVSSANVSFHRVLRGGLAANLRSLVLRSVCDNEILRLLGRHCPHLRHLDATSSWLVDDNGLRSLCFKEQESHTLPPDGYCGDTCGWFSAIQPSDLNICCRSLQEVRIQDTNTSELGVIMLLLFIPNLKSLGGFIYYRNVGDAIMNLSQHYDGKLKLNLTDLWDTCLSPEKASILSAAAPQLASLYTRGSWLHSVGSFSHLVALTVDFDFVDFSPALESYLIEHGQKLQKLVLVDQIHSVDVSMLAENCPCLKELGAKLEGGWYGEAGAMLPQLVICRIRVGATETLHALLVHTPRLEHLEVSKDQLH